MSDRPVCKRCSQRITGIIKVAVSRKKLGNKSIPQSDYYDEACYYTYNQERALNEFKKERNSKRPNKK